MDLSLLFIAYGRFNNIQKNLDNLDLNKFDKVYIYIDGPKDEKVLSEQIKFLKNNTFNAEIITNKTNYGVRKFIPHAISDVFKKSKYLLILEDDIMISNLSVKFINNKLDNLNTNIISLFSPYSYHSNLISYDGGIWGWCVSNDIWKKFNWTKESLFNILYVLLKRVGIIKAIYFAPLVYMSQRNLIKSWAYQWFYVRIKEDIKSLIPGSTLSINVGIGDQMATSTKRNHRFSIYEISEELMSFDEHKSLSLNKLLGYSYFEILVRILYNWFRLIKK